MLQVADTLLMLDSIPHGSLSLLFSGLEGNTQIIILLAENKSLPCEHLDGRVGLALAFGEPILLRKDLGALGGICRMLV